MISAALDALLGQRRWSQLPSEMNTVLVSHDKRYVVRLAPVDDFSPVDVNLTVTVARALAEHDVPAIRLAAGLTQPAMVDGRAATIWDYVPPDSEPCTETATLMTLALLHRVEDARLPSRDIRPAVTERLVRLRAEQPDRAAYWSLLEQWTDDVAGVWEGLEVSAVHGDLRACNVVGHRGTAVLIDLDAAGRGPRLYDFWRFAVDARAGRADPNWFADICTEMGFAMDDRSLEPFVRLLRLAHTTLAEFRGDPAPIAMFESWWVKGAVIEEVPGWIEE